MILPSIDLMAGRAVQLRGGREKVLDAGDPLEIARQFRVAGEICVIDLCAALGTGSNREAIEPLLRAANCRVGGGIRDVETALHWLDAGASKVILGTRAEPELLSQLPRERVIAALDAVHGEVVVEGWRTATGRTVAERMAELRNHVSGFLVTFVEREGRMQGIDLGAVQAIRECAGDADLTIAGGVTTAAEIAALDRLGCAAQVGMALYTGRLTLAAAIAAPLQSDREDGLWPTVVVDEQGHALGLAWSSAASLEQAVRERRGVYQSRRRGLWVKGETSGNTQELLRVGLDCDRDALRFVVRQDGDGFCHLPARTCWGDDTGLSQLERRLRERLRSAPAESYTRRLFREPSLLDAKLREEAAELATAAGSQEVTHEAADLLYFTLVRMVRDGVSLADVEAELRRRSLRVTRRPGDPGIDPGKVTG